MFLQEVDLLRRLEHPNLVDYISASKNKLNNQSLEIFLLLEDCPYGNLADNIRCSNNEIWSERQVLILFRTLCLPVLYLHFQNPPIIHRDIKLENYILSKNNVYKLCDLGSAVCGPRDIRSKEARSKEEYIIAKTTTALYRAPEIADLDGYAMFGKGIIDEKIDVWSLGCILYALCFRKLPFSGEGLHTSKFTIPKTSIYSSSLHELIQHCLTEDVEKRSDISHILECIGAIQNQKPLPIYVYAPQESMTAEAISLPSATITTAASPRGDFRNSNAQASTQRKEVDLLSFDTPLPSSSANYTPSLVNPLDSSMDENCVRPTSFPSNNIFKASTSPHQQILVSNMNSSAIKLDEFGFPIDNPNANTSSRSNNPFG